MPNGILVTGANGFVGSHLVNDLTMSLAEDNTVVAAVRDEKQDLWTKTALSGAIITRLDLSQSNSLEKLKRVLSYYDIDQIYHLASQAIVSRARKNPLDTYSTNIMGTARILEAARQIGTKHVLHISTDKVYGEGHVFTPKTYFKPTEPYSSSKTCAEYVIEDYRREFEMNISVARPCNIIGYDKYNLTRIVPATITKLMTGETPVIYDTKSVRQYIYIDDAVQMLQDIIKSGININIGSPYILTPRQIITQICRFMGKEDQYKIVKANFHEIQGQSMDYLHEFEYTPLDEALKETILRFETYG